jgi:uncharacterized membrane protein
VHPAVDFIAKTTLFGFGGWAIENIFDAPRFSPVFSGAPVPFLPVYAVGGATVMAMAPYLQKLPWYARLPVYAVALSGVEFASCIVNRKLLDACSWDYSNAHCTRSLEGCIDVKHAIIWGVLGLAAEGLSWALSATPRRRRQVAR